MIRFKSSRYKFVPRLSNTFGSMEQGKIKVCISTLLQVKGIKERPAKTAEENAFCFSSAVI